ncbi:MAG: hypothetical protein OXC31_03585 [Spirochaetaceae bacterium]|nr:hypothetical protein [Spirochaetaceae bacterium]
MAPIAGGSAESRISKCRFAAQKLLDDYPRGCGDRDVPAIAGTG